MQKHPQKLKRPKNSTHQVILDHHHKIIPLSFPFSMLILSINSDKIIPINILNENRNN